MVDLLNRYRAAVLFIALVFLVYFPVFLHLDYMPIRMWDESILGANAIEMGHNHNYLVTYFGGSPEMSNTKPPLMIWCILFFTRLLGFSELSLRLPSALAALILCIFLFQALRRYTGNPFYGFLVVVVFVTCQGYIRNHVTRTGEYDSLLIMFSTIAAIHLFLATEAETNPERSKHLVLFFVLLTLAVLTKGVAPLMLAPGLLVYVLFRRKAMLFLKRKAFYTGLFFFIFFGPGYYFLRETVNPGYLQAVWSNELGGRFMAVNEGHEGPWYFYFSEIISWQFVNYYLLFPVALLSGIFLMRDKVQHLVVFAFITGLFFLLFISLSGTKLSHYDAPLFPYLAIITASLFYRLFVAIRSWLGQYYKILSAGIVAAAIILAMLAKPYADILAKVYFPKGDWWEEGFSTSCTFFQDVAKGRERLLASKLVYNTTANLYGPPAVFNDYKEELTEKGMTLSIDSVGQINDNDTLLMFEDADIRGELERRFTIQNIQRLEQYHLDLVRVKLKNE